jgi:hypothetical protein
MAGVRIAQRLTRLFSQTVTLYPWTGQDAYGQATYGEGFDYRAHVQNGTVRTTGENPSLPGLYKVIIGEAVQIDPRDKLELPAEYGTRNDSGTFESPTTEIVEVQYLNDSRGPVATVVLCGKG